MKRLLIAVPVLLAVGFLSACSAGDPKPTTYISDTGVTLNGDIYSSFCGDATYFWKYSEDTSFEHPDAAPDDPDQRPSSRTRCRSPLAGLTAGTTYHSPAVRLGRGGDPQPRELPDGSHVHHLVGRGHDRDRVQLRP